MDDVKNILEQGTPAKRGKKWTLDDEVAIVRGFRSGKSVIDLMPILERSEVSIRSRAKNIFNKLLSKGYSEEFIYKNIFRVSEKKYYELLGIMHPDDTKTQSRELYTMTLRALAEMNKKLDYLINKLT